MHLAFFMDEVPVETQTIYGWSLVFVVAALCTINMLVVFYELARYIALVVIKYHKRFTHTKSDDAASDNQP